MNIRFFEGKEYFDYIEKFKNEILLVFLNCNRDADKLNYFYHERISNISRVFLDEVKEYIYGYCTFKAVYKPLEKVRSINEFLHLLHADIINSDSFYIYVKDLVMLRN